MASTSQRGGRYTLIRPLGEGATKEVFLARDETLQRDVALCVFKPHVTSTGFLARIRREARTLAGLSHSNIVQLYDLAEDDGCYLVTEYISGGSLKSKISTDWKEHANLDEALRIATEVADALAETHSKGIFHRDVKPNNVMLTSDGTAKLGDFGLAKPHGDETNSEEGLIVGTIPYMSPEQAKGLPADSPGDMYSFGVMLYEMVAGRRPFHGEDASVLVHHLNSTPPPPTRYVPNCPPRLEALILSLLDKWPESRPTASETAAQLRQIRSQQANGPSDIKGREPTAEASALNSYQASTPTSEADSSATPGGRRTSFFRVAALALGLALVFIAWREPWISPQPSVSIDQVCEVDRRLTYDIVPGPAHAQNLPSLYRISHYNQPIFDHLNKLREDYQSGKEHKGITYVYGDPGVGKTFLVRNYLSGLLSKEASCVVKLGEVFSAAAAGKREFEVIQRPDVFTLDGRISLGKLPAIADPGKFQIETFLSESGCAHEDALVPLIIIDDIDETHPDSSRLILRLLDKLILDGREPKADFQHVIVVGGSEGFTSWYRDPKRHGGISKFLNVFKLSGPVYSSTGDIGVLVTNLFIFKKGKEAWQRALRNGTAALLIKQYLRDVRQHRFLTYSIRALATATYISDRSDTSANDTEFELKEFLVDEMLRRSTSIYGRPDPLDDSYRRVLEVIASRYANRLDPDGFFVVNLEDTVPLTTQQGDKGEVRVRDVLNRSGIAITVPESHSTTSYRFEPVWIQAHLIELANKRSSPRYQYRSCSRP